MRDVCDPVVAQKRLEAARKAGTVKVETKQPTKKGDSLVLTVVPTGSPDRKEVYELDPTSKVAERVTYYERQGKGWKQVKLVERLKGPVDPKVFDPDLPKDIVKCDEIRRPPGLVQGGLTNDQIATKVARESSRRSSTRITTRPA